MQEPFKRLLCGAVGLHDTLSAGRAKGEQFFQIGEIDLLTVFHHRPRWPMPSASQPTHLAP